MKRAAALVGLVLALVVAMYWTGRAEQDDPRFTGRSDTMDAKDLGIGRRSFEPGARSAWHSHDKGQLIFVEQGRARVQKKGQPMRELGLGESDYTPPNVVHWHGATPGDRLVQVAVSFGGEIKWLQKTTDDEYSGKSRD
jgi:quercetin dioxygenase-like cupin family protein